MQGKPSDSRGFTEDFHRRLLYFGLHMPPIILVSRVLKKMESCKAKGILVLPEWRSANFWPLLYANDREMKPFI